MKKEEDFDYERDICDELKLNNCNLQKIFQVQFESFIRKQSNLFLNQVNNPESKNILLQYIKSEPIKLMIKEQLMKEHILTKFINFKKNQNKKHPTLTQILDTHISYQQNKSRNDYQSLTMFNQYVIISNVVQSCFIPKKGFQSHGDKEEHEINDQQGIKNNKCDLAMKTYKKKYFSEIFCQYCLKHFINQRGRMEHIRHCSKKYGDNTKQSPINEPKRRSTRRSKKHHKTLNENDI